jgi:hypothetical protein
MMASYKLASLSNEANLGPIIQYIDRLPADFAGTFAKSAVNRQKNLVLHPAMGDWCKRNASLMALLSTLQ